MDYNDNVQIVQGRLSVSYTFLEQFYSDATITPNVSKGAWEQSHKGWVFYESILKANERIKRKDYKKDLPSYSELELSYNKAQTSKLPQYFGYYEKLIDLEYFTIKYDAELAVCLKRAAGILRFLIEIKGKKDAKKLGFESKKAVYLAVLDYLKVNQNTIKGIGNGTNMRYLQQKITDFKNEGTKAITWEVAGNQNRRLVKGTTENVLLYLAFSTYERIPTAASLHKKYKKFLSNDGELIKTDTGEVYSAADCVEISNDAVYDLLKKRPIRLALEKKYTSALHHNSTQSPFTHRNKASFSLAKLSMDDKVMRFTLENGIQCWAYLVFDVHSTAIIGYSYEFDSKKNGEFKSGKNIDLFKNCIVNTFEFLHKNGLQNIVPWQVEAEQHLANTAKETYLKEGVIFPFVRFARGGNAQEKHAERNIRNFKYNFEGETKGFKARPFLQKLENRLNTDKKLHKYNQYQLSNMVSSLISDYNNDIQEKYQKSRLERFFEGVNREKMQEVSYMNLAYWLGEKVETTVRRNQYFDGFTERFLMPFDVDSWFFKLKSEKIQAYKLPFLDNKVWVFQGANFVCEAELLTEEMKVNTAMVERTEQDTKNLGKFYRQKQQYEAIVKDKINEFSMKVIDISTPKVREVKTKNEGYFAPKKETFKPSIYKPKEAS
ncbi:hypothetical protein V9L05_19845 [Bernardetia sp. Wsw4-3y2]|uniref:hypothetical protein n=1 Tax=Bernardetia sp. Wsw4-3y2 TaxID=3127471 RepID=UPI0030CB2C75